MIIPFLISSIKFIRLLIKLIKTLDKWGKWVRKWSVANPTEEVCKKRHGVLYRELYDLTNYSLKDIQGLGFEPVVK